MPHTREERDNVSENCEHHSNISDDSRPTLDRDLELPSVQERAKDERLEILINGEPIK